MAGTNDNFVFGTSLFSEYDFGELPKGDMFAFGMNPYNGLVVVKYNHNLVPMEVTDRLLREMSDRVAFLSDACDGAANFYDLAAFCKGELVIEDFEPCPFCGCVPEYDLVTGTVICCGGRLRVTGFSSRPDAVRSWNERRFVKVA